MAKSGTYLGQSGRPEGLSRRTAGEAGGGPVPQTTPPNNFLIQISPLNRNTTSYVLPKTRLLAAELMIWYQCSIQKPPSDSGSNLMPFTLQRTHKLDEGYPSGGLLELIALARYHSETVLLYS